MKVEATAYSAYQNFLSVGQTETTDTKVGNVYEKIAGEQSDSVEISKEAYDKQEQAFWLRYLEDSKESAKQAQKATKDIIDNQAKALETARRIAKGGKVPSTDEKKLMEYSKELYMMAKQQAMMAKKHKQYKSLYKDEKDTKELEKQRLEASDTIELSADTEANAEMNTESGGEAK